MTMQQTGSDSEEPVDFDEIRFEPDVTRFHIVAELSRRGQGGDPRRNTTVPKAGERGRNRMPAATNAR
jgi:hypothetical protein